MRSSAKRTIWSLAGAGFMAALLTACSDQAGSEGVQVDADDIGGVVTSSQGPEAGVWVVAETDDLGTKFVRIVVTDDEGQYVLPDLPDATFDVFVRGYGLVDSTRVQATPGQLLDLEAVVAPDAQAAAAVYPANYWLGLASIPEGDLTEREVVRAVKGCLACHQVGDLATREIPAVLTYDSHLEAWDRRVQSGQHGAGMSRGFRRLGPQREMFSDWTDRIAAGEFPVEPPPRPQGVERNLVVTLWDWGRPTSYLHDEGAADQRDPTVLPNDGRIYGAVQSDDTLAWVDPVANTTGEIEVVPTVPFDLSLFGTPEVLEPSPYWDDEVIYDAQTQPRNATVDGLGRIWSSVAIRDPRNQPDFCKEGSSHPSAQYFPIEGDGATRPGRVKQFSIYDPQAGEFNSVDTCYTTEHPHFGPDPDNTVYTGGGNVLGWLKTSVFDETGDEQASQGWCPAVLDTNADGVITEWTEPDEPIDPSMDHRVNFGCYSTSVQHDDGSIWCAGGGGGDFITRIDFGDNPPETCIAETFSPPEDSGAWGGPYVALDSTGVAWSNWRGADVITSFDRSKCAVLNGPTATGDHCPEGWTVYPKPGPTFEGSSLSSDLTYLQAVDQFDGLGLGKDVPISYAVNSDSLMALSGPDRDWVTLRIPYPQGFFTRSSHPRIEDPDAGWKGRGLWSNISTYAPWHIEGGKGTRSKLVKMQIRPSPLDK